ncbi:MAG TPA: alpha-amylase family protein [Opitutus sp.]|nr:alpha-amylase family protein [Opitutus sp.]
MSDTPKTELSRRHFVQTIAGGAALLATGGWRLSAAGGDSPARVPWFRRAVRWGQTNLTEIDPRRFDLAWWREYWKQTCVQGVVVNAGGIVAYYPSAVPLQRRAQFLGDRDLFGEILHAAHEDGIAVFARMDSNRADETFHRAHPDWFAVDADGKPYKSTGLYIACVNGPYYDEHIPAILREVATRYRPEGFTDNSWSGPTRQQPCFCANCERKFRARSGRGIPRATDWNDPVYRDWIMWNYERRTEIWDEFNRIARAAGGPECLWVGMMSGSQEWQARVFRDDREIYRRTELVMLDDQRRNDSEGFQHNGEIGKRIRAVGGWDKVIPESMSMYMLADRIFRLAAKPEPEARMWVIEGIAGGVQPWWHMLGSVQEDRRVFETAPPLWQWHRDHEEFLINRRPVVTVGLVWSQRNTDFFGRDDAGALVGDPWNGWMQALVRARIPYVPVHIDDLERVAGELGLRAIILPNLAALSDAQVAAVGKFVGAGGSLVATGQSSLCNEWGETRPDFALAHLFGVRLPATHPWRDETRRTKASHAWSQTYLRLPKEKRPEVLGGFEATDILAFGGELEPIEVAPGATVPLTFVPPVPAMPPEEVWMREPKTDIAALVLNEKAAGGGRVAYLPADLDRRFARGNLPDHGDLLAKLVRWAARDDVPLRVEGAGLFDCQLYRQPGRLVLHLVNLTSAGTWRTPVQELIPVGPLRVTVRLDDGVNGARGRWLVRGGSFAAQVRDGWARFDVAPIADHEVVVIG